jgi:hypothetical protein
MKINFTVEQFKIMKNFGYENKKEFKEQLWLVEKEGFKIKKMWTTSVWYENKKPKICEKHLPYEKLEYVNLDYEYKPGLKFPFDPDCKDPEEFNNCRCWMAYKIIN